MRYIVKKVDIELIEKRYDIFANGLIQSKRKIDPVRGSNSKAGYNHIDFRLNGEYVRLYRHRVIATKFISNPKGKPCVNHKDGNKLNNSAENLEWCTHKENTAHAYESNLMRPRKSHLIGKKLEMVKYLNAKYSQEDIADLLNMTQPNISKALNR